MGQARHTHNLKQVEVVGSQLPTILYTNSYYPPPLQLPALKSYIIHICNMLFGKDNLSLQEKKEIYNATTEYILISFKPP